jgi:hypothetical protein
MGRRIDENRPVEAEREAPPLGQPVASRRRGAVPVLLLVAAVVVVVAAVWIFAVTRSSPRVVKPATPASVAPSTRSGSTSPASVSMPAATTIQAFAALPAAQQQAIMQQALDTYDEVVAEAARTLDASILSDVATGAELQVQQQGLAGQQGRPESMTGQGTVIAVQPAPQYGFVSIQVEGSETDQWLDPTTLKPEGTPISGSARSSFSLVIEGGVWKVSEHIQESQ